jgi:hypothetical protein
MNFAAFHFDPVEHRYTLGGMVLPSVTQILAPIKPDFSMVSADVLERKRQLGQAVHAACELDDDGDLDEGETDPLVLAYLQGWRKFRADTGALVLENERQLFHPTLMYAGTLDRSVSVNGETWLVDLKTVYPNPVPSFGVQLAGYDLLRQADGAEPAAKRASVHLLPDGKYRMKTYTNPNDFVCFRALLSLSHWKKENLK